MIKEVMGYHDINYNLQTPKLKLVSHLLTLFIVFLVISIKAYYAYS